MPFDPKIHHRKSIRLDGYDYSLPGAYFVTIVTQGRVELLGEIQNHQMKNSLPGQIVQRTWDHLHKNFQSLEQGAFCIMPNHIHAVLILNAGTTSLSEIVRWFKSTTSRRINEFRKTSGIPVWQRDYYERIIRNENEHKLIDLYIKSNPTMWDQDDENNRNA